MPFDLLAQLWLHEPDQAMAVRGSSLFGLAPADPGQLAVAYTDIFLLNVYPYGTIFTDPVGEMNGPAAQAMARLYAQHGYQPPELSAVGAPDHLGLGLGFLGHSTNRGLEDAFAQACGELLAWALLACLAVEREPGAHAFYRGLAAFTADTLLLNAGRFTIDALDWQAQELPGLALAMDQSAVDDDEVRLRDLVRFFLTPARSGIFLSRGRLGGFARELGVALPFGARYDVATALFTAAGQSERLDLLLNQLAAEVQAWAAVYRQWATTYPAWAAVAEHWLNCTAGTLRLVSAMRDRASAEHQSVPAEPG